MLAIIICSSCFPKKSSKLKKYIGCHNMFQLFTNKSSKLKINMPQKVAFCRRHDLLKAFLNLKTQTNELLLWGKCGPQAQQLK